MKHFDLIKKYCTVFAETENAIFYKDGSRKIAEINGASFSCGSTEEFYEMVKLFGKDNFSE